MRFVNIITMNTKTCTKCGRELPPSAFGKHRLCKDGLNPECKDCNKKRAKKYSKTASGLFTLLKGRQTYARAHKGKKDRGYHRIIKPITISREDFIKWYDIQPKICVYCGISEEQLGKTGDKYNDKNLRLSIDCKNNDLGYIKGNLVLSCNRCNSIKSDFLTYEEMLEIGRKFVALRWFGKVREGL